MIQGRNYQEAALDAALVAWGLERIDLKTKHATLIDELGKNPFTAPDGVATRSTLANMATGTGKTILAGLLIDYFAKKGMRGGFMADTNELCQQPLEKIRATTGIFAGLEKAESKAPRSASVVVASEQTLSKTSRLEAFIARWGTPHYWITDEAHRGSHAAKKIHDAFGPDCKILGITATPFRSGLRDLSDFFETVCFEFNTLDAIDAGWLVPLKVQTLPITIDLSSVKVKRKADGQSDYDENEVDEVITPYYEEIAKSLKTHAEGRKIVSFLPLITSSKKWVEVCRDNGINARHVDGSSDDREELIVQFDRGELDLISNSQLLTAGWDCLICDCLLNMKPTRSVNQFQQMVGRTFRPLRGIVDVPGLSSEERKQRILDSEKPNSLILDLLWQVEELGLVGPGSIVAASPEMAAEIEKKLREKKTPEELREIMEQVRRDREEALRAELEAKAARKAMLMDAREIALQLRDNSILEYEPVAKWESDKPSEKQAQVLESMGIDTETVTSKGLASKLMDSIFTRQSKGKAPLEAFRALRDKGVQNPEKMSLDDAIRTLGTDFPMTFGKKYRGIPMSRVPSGFWTWMRKLPPSQLASIRLQHPAAVRFMEKMTSHR